MRIDDSKALATIRAQGRDPLSFQSQLPCMSHWHASGASPSDDLIDSFIAYLDLGPTWIAAGPPIAPEGQEVGLLQQFFADTRRRRIKGLLFGAPPSLLNGLNDARVTHSALHLGEIPHWDLQHWGKSQERREFFSQVRRAERKSVSVREVSWKKADDTASAFRSQAESLFSHWVGSRPLPPLGFVATALPFYQCHQRRFFAAYVEKTLVAFAVASPVCARKGWFLENVIRRQGAPNGTVERLLAATFAILKKEGSTYATLGMVPLSVHGASNHSHGSPLWARTLFSFCRRHLEGLYHFQGLKRFKEKLAPDHWTPQYLLAPTPIGPLELAAVLKAFANGNLPRYTASAARRIGDGGGLRDFLTYSRTSRI
jgi:phosphatidylglycerol lysyltransferase